MILFTVFLFSTQGEGTQEQEGYSDEAGATRRFIGPNGHQPSEARLPVVVFVLTGECSWFYRSAVLPLKAISRLMMMKTNYQEHLSVAKKHGINWRPFT